MHHPVRCSHRHADANRDALRVRGSGHLLHCEKCPARRFFRQIYLMPATTGHARALYPLTLAPHTTVTQLNGKKPEPFQKYGERFTLKYHRPILLDTGRRTIKAIALSRKVLNAAPSNVRTKFVEVVDVLSNAVSLSESEEDASKPAPRRPAGTRSRSPYVAGHLGETKRKGRKGSHRHRRRSRSPSESSTASSSDLSDVGRYTGRETWREAAHNPPGLTRMDDALASGSLLPRDGKDRTAVRVVRQGHHRGRRSASSSRSPSPTPGRIDPDTHCTVCHAERPRGQADFCDSCGTPLSRRLRGGSRRREGTAVPRARPPPGGRYGLPPGAQDSFAGTVGAVQQPPPHAYPGPNAAGAGGYGDEYGAQRPGHQSAYGTGIMPATGTAWGQQLAPQPLSSVTMHATHPLSGPAASMDLAAGWAQQSPTVPQRQPAPYPAVGGGIVPGSPMQQIPGTAPSSWHEQHGAFWEAATQVGGETINGARETLAEAAEEAPFGRRRGGSGAASSAGRHGKISTVGTQTTGLYFPSSAQMKNNKAKARVKEDTTPISMVSPGQGYWRLQLDHLGHHLKQYARDNPAFQSASGQPIMGEVRAARIEEEGDVVVFTVVLARKDPPAEEILLTDEEEALARQDARQAEEMAAAKKAAEKREAAAKKVAREKQRLQRQTQSSTRSRRSEGHTAKVAESPRAKRSTRLANVKSTAEKAELDPATKLLLAELGPSGEGNEDVVLGLIDEGADVNAGKSSAELCHRLHRYVAASIPLRAEPFSSHATTHNHALRARHLAVSPRREHVLYLAALHARVSAVPLLVDAASKVNTRSSMGETALHAAVRASSNNMELIDALIAAGADPTIRNTNGLSPLALAGTQEAVPTLGYFDGHSVPSLPLGWHHGSIAPSLCLV